jgi:fumarylacetoacetase
MTASWLDIPSDSDFSLSNVPFGIFSLPPEDRPRCGTALGEYAVDLALLAEAGLLDDVFPLSRSIFRESTLNCFMQQPRPTWVAVRSRIIQLFEKDGPNHGLFENKELRSAAIRPLSEVTMHLPATIGDYTDFYSSKYHAINVGTMFRGKDNALQPNWLHLPVGYHGRSSTVVVSGTPIRRPCGQLQKDATDAKQGSTYGPCRLLDFELEVAFFVGGPDNVMGEAVVSVEQAYDRIFGFSLMNDWSARDIQKWEYVPLGPFTAKNFGTTISPWIITTMALEPFGDVKLPSSSGESVAQDPLPLDYLQDTTRKSSFDVQLEVAIQGNHMNKAENICRSNFSNLYWTSAQQLVHHAVTGCSMKAGDLLGSGTISGPAPDSYGSMLELSWKGTKEVLLGESGQFRKYVQDGDTVVMKGWAQKDGYGRVGFGPCNGKVLPAILQPQPADITSAHTTSDRYINFKLYQYWQSSSSWRVRIALEAKGIPYEMAVVNLKEKANQSDHYQSLINPMGQVPALQFRDTRTGKTACLSQSVAIMEFLEDAFPNSTPLLPIDPLDRASARAMIEVINSGTQPLQNAAILRDLEERSQGRIKATEEGNRRVRKGLTAMEAMVKERQSESGSHSLEYCMGGFNPSLVDVVLVPQLSNAKHLYGIDLETSFPTLAKIENACLQHPWFSKTLPSLQPGAM